MSRRTRVSTFGGEEARRAILALLSRQGPLTADEIAERCGAHVLRVRPRVAELAKGVVAGRPLKGGVQITDSGKRGVSALGKPSIVWRLA